MVVSFSLDMVQLVRDMCKHRGGASLQFYVRAAGPGQLEAFYG